ncbi:MAG TPA: hypothetical protein VMK65_14105 [Longimicrobiales bacterium]|nr:hypothetical protein [Longimicrobiales bacterium]
MDSRPPPDFADLIARLGVELEARRIPFMLMDLLNGYEQPGEEG